MTKNPTTEDLKKQVRILSEELEHHILTDQRLKIISEISSDMIFHINLQGKVTYASPATENILGYTPEEAINSWFSKYYAPGEQQKVRKILYESLKGKELKAVEINALRKNNTIVPIQISISPISSNGKVIEIQGIARDISREKNIREELKQKKDYAELLLETVPSAVFTVDNDRIIRSWNSGQRDHRV